MSLLGPQDPLFFFRTLETACSERHTALAWHGIGHGVLHLLGFGIAIGVAWLSIHNFLQPPMWPSLHLPVILLLKLSGHLRARPAHDRHKHLRGQRPSKFTLSSTIAHHKMLRILSSELVNRSTAKDVRQCCRRCHDLPLTLTAANAISGYWLVQADFGAELTPRIRVDQ